MEEMGTDWNVAAIKDFLQIVAGMPPMERGSFVNRARGVRRW
jgi:hypothetical protein